MKLLALTEAAQHVCYRYRLAAFRDALRQRQWDIEPMPLARGIWHRTRQLRQVGRYDAVLLQRRLLPLWQLHQLRRAARLLIYDFDDALYLRDSFSPKGTSSWKRLAHFWATLHAADLIIAGSAHLAEVATAYVGPERVHRVPTCIDAERYSPATHRRRETDVQLVWIGSRSTLPYLQQAQAGLHAAAARLPGLRIKVICDTFPQWEHPRVVPCHWQADREALELHRADIGIAWLTEDDWARGKCGLKVLQYMAAGLPVVANRVGIHTTLVQPGKTGFLASTPKETATAIHRLALDPRLRQTMGHAARQQVQRDFSTRRWGPELAGLIDDAWRVQRKLPLLSKVAEGGEHGESLRRPSRVVSACAGDPPR
jgi:glycosyltransferase involved in cell wall biosynthesis